MDSESPPKDIEKQPLELSVLLSLLERTLNLNIICISRSWGGLEQVAATDALDLGATGVMTTVLCMEGTPIYEFLKDKPQVQLVPIDYQPRNLFDLEMRSEIKRLVSRGINLFHLHQPSLLGSVIPWLWNSPYVGVVASRHIMNNHQKKDFFHRAIYRRLDALLVMSNMLRRNVIQTHAIRPSKVKLVRLGLDFDRFDPVKVNGKELRARWGADDNTKVIGLVGRIDPAKGQAVFIKAAAGLVRDQSDLNIKFVLIGDETRGSDGRFLKELREMIAQFRLEKSFVLTGFMDNIPEVMSALDIFVMPSRQEAFGLVAIEAMAMERAVIISQGGSAEEIVGMGGALIGGKDHRGLIVRPDDAFDLQQKMRFLIDHPEERIEMGKRGRARVLLDYDRKLRLRRTLEVYERVLRRRGAI